MQQREKPRLQRAEDVVIDNSLAKKTRLYWNASLAWNGKRKAPLSAKEQNDKLLTAALNVHPGYRLSHRCYDQIDKIIKYGTKPKRVKSVPSSA